MAVQNVPILILGTGIAGLSAAIKLSDLGHTVLLACKTLRTDGATRYAQGGIASVWSQHDSFEEHEADTLTSGAGLCRQEIVKICVNEGPARVRELIDLGVGFTKVTENFDLHREGGHGKRRILHAGDLTGWEIERALLAQINQRPNIKVLEHRIAIDLITEAKILKRKSSNRCLGAYLLNTQTGEIETYETDVVVLATGGAGKVYLYTSNPDTATGDGIAMAYRAGARVANLEFMQFHPTCLYHPKARTFLISEALRGEGAVLRTLDGTEFMSRYHSMGALASRDHVARAIDHEMKRTGDKHVWLDATMITDVQTKFPNIYETCAEYGINISKDFIPVVPAAHYTCGGIQTNEWGQSSLSRLYAIGETACTGLHGANRLASNSLLEGVVFAHRACESIHHALIENKSRRLHARTHSHKISYPSAPPWDTGRATPLEDQIDIAASWLEIRQLMWNYVGIVRSNTRLERARRRLQLIHSEIHEAYWDYLLTKDLVELRNLVTVAELIVESAISRKESRGLHFTVDHPKQDDTNFLHDTVL